MNKVLVTGANGFIGKALCAYLRDAGCEVHGLIRNGTGDSARWPSVHYHVHTDICDVSSYEPHMSGMDGVVHLAGRVHQMKDTSPQLLAEYQRVNVRGTMLLAEAAVRAGVRRFVYVSSIKAESETDDEPYATSKREAEIGLRDLAAATGMELVIFRPCLVYGPGVRANFDSLMKCVLAGIPLPLAGITNRRSFLYVTNLTHAIYIGLVHKRAPGHTFPVSDGCDLSTTELIRCMSEAAGRRPRLFRLPGLLSLAGRLTGRTAAIERLTGSLTADIGELRHRLGWEPPFSTKEGIRQTVDGCVRERRNTSS